MGADLSIDRAERSALATTTSPDLSECPAPLSPHHSLALGLGQPGSGNRASRDAEATRGPGVCVVQVGQQWPLWHLL